MAALLLGGRSRRRDGTPAVTTRSDEFTATELARFWTEIDPLNAETVTLTGSALRLTHSGTVYTDLNATENTAWRLVQNYVGDFDVTFAWSRNLANDFESYGFYVDDGSITGNYRAAFAFIDPSATKAWYPRRQDGVSSEDSWPYPDATVGWGRYQRATLSGGTLTWWLSPTGADGSWTQMYSIPWSGGANQRIGVLRGANQSVAPIDLEYFRIAGSGSGGTDGGGGTPGTSPGPAPTPTAGKPGAPTAVTAKAGGGPGRIILSWAPPTSDGGAAITGYVVQRDGTSLDGYGQWTDTTDPAARSYEFWNLREGDTYPVRVAAVNAQGQGPWTSTSYTSAQVATLIEAPTTCTLTGIAGGFTADWNDVAAPDNNFARYEYRIGGANPPAGLPISAGTASSATITVPTTTPQYIQVRSVNNANIVGAWSQVFGPVTPLAAPPPPPPG